MFKTCFVQQPDGGAKGINTCHIHASRLKTKGIRFQAKILLRKIFLVHHAFPSYPVRMYKMIGFLGNIHYSTSHGTQEPFVPSGRQEMYSIFFYIHGDDPQTLDGIHTEEDSLSSTEISQSFQIATKTRRKVYGTYGDESGPRHQRLFCILHMERSVFSLDASGAHSLECQVFPGVQIGRKFRVGDEHHISLPPL